MNARQTLKQLLKRNKLLVAPGCFDGLSARLVQEAGFEAAYLSGGAVARSMGIPDIGLVTMSESIDRAVQVVAAINIPIIADADTGYGNAVNLVRSVREFERAGVAAIHIEDQITPKRCGHLDGKEVISLSEMAKKARSGSGNAHRSRLLHHRPHRRPRRQRLRRRGQTRQCVCQVGRRRDLFRSATIRR